MIAFLKVRLSSELLLKNMDSRGLLKKRLKALIKVKTGVSLRSTIRFTQAIRV